MSSYLARSPWGDVLSLGAGILLPLAFAPYGLYPLAVISLAALFFSWLTISPRRAAFRGWLFGVGMFGFGVTWVYISIHQYGEVPLALSLFLTALFVVFLASYPAIAGYVFARYFSVVSGGRVSMSLLVFMPAIWTLIEWLRGWFFTGFPWLNVGYSQSDSLLNGFVPVLGVYGVSWMVAISAGLLVLVVICRGFSSRLRYVGAFAGLWIVAVLLGVVKWADPVGEPLTVSLVQGNIPQNIKWLRETRQPTIDLYTELTRAHWDSDLVIWPETAVPDFYYRQRDFFDDLTIEARANKTDLLIGVLTMDIENERYYNSMVSIGEEKAFYNKRHLVPFTEYLPLTFLLGRIVDFMNVPMSDFTPGNVEKVTLKAAGQTVGISICYEDAFGEEVIDALPQATLLVNVSNDAWFGGSIAPHQHLQIARMRSIETARPLLRATNTGVSAIINYDGKMLAVAPQFKVEVISAKVQPMAGSTPYSLMGNWAIVGLLFTVLFAGWWVVQRRNSSRVSFK